MLEIRETYVNATENCRIGDSGWYEPFTGNREGLFRSLQREYGRCTGRMYRDVKVTRAGLPGLGPLFARPVRETWTAIAVGWVFSKRDRYADARGSAPSDHYARDVWVEVRETPDEDSKEN
jgi:hypothetical protein